MNISFIAYSRTTNMQLFVGKNMESVDQYQKIQVTAPNI